MQTPLLVEVGAQDVRRRGIVYSSPIFPDGAHIGLFTGRAAVLR
jgi:hypothetical protein